MRISQRLQAVISEISGETLADIGTDHGYIAIEALRLGRVSRAILCDIKPGPLGRAEANVLAAGFASAAETRLGDGLSPLRPGEADCVSIAGMGGMLMADILKSGADVLKKVRRLVLQPQSDAETVRRLVHSAGFNIADERMIFEGRFYNIMRCERACGNSPPSAGYTCEGYALGQVLIDRKDIALKQYLARRISECEKILRTYQNADIFNEKKMCEGVLKCL